MPQGHPQRKASAALEELSEGGQILYLFGCYIIMVVYMDILNGFANSKLERPVFDHEIHSDFLEKRRGLEFKRSFILKNHGIKHIEYNGWVQKKDDWIYYPVFEELMIPALGERLALGDLQKDKVVELYKVSEVKRGFDVYEVYAIKIGSFVFPD
jgi:hypothetical protein